MSLNPNTAIRIAPVLAQGSSNKVIGRGMIGKGMTDMTLVLFLCQIIPLPFFSLVSGRYQILRFVAVRVKLDASVQEEKSHEFEF